MDSLGALSVAAAVVQFVDFGSRVLSDACHIYESSSGQTSVNLELSTATDDLSRLMDDVRSKAEKAKPLNTAGPDGLNDSEEIFLRLCRECKEISGKLRHSLEKFRASGANKIDLAVKSVLLSMKGVMAENDIKTLKDRLGQIREQMKLAVLIFLWGESKSQNQVFLSFAEQQASIVCALDRIDKTTSNFSNQLVDIIQGNTSEEAQKMFEYILSPSWKPDNFTKGLMLGPDSRMSPDQIRQRTEIIIHSLLFEEVGRREEAIPKAYCSTLEWIFEHPHCTEDGKPLWSDFLEWLTGPSEDIYWVTGKPGAGKSTLIKFIGGDERLKSGLKKWAEGARLIIGTYFSWNAGADLQKSHSGLLRTLLYQILSEMPERELLLPLLFPGRWAVFQLLGKLKSIPDWGFEELLGGFRTLIPYATQHSCNIALLVDGLDEFDEGHELLAEMLHEANLQPSVKICTSSRPWNIFRGSFKHSPTLQLEELTENDIKFYVQDKFAKSDGFQETRVLHPKEATNIMETVVARARGVFLWVDVVVKLLLQDLQEGSKLAALQATLNSLPSDLHDLYSAIWARISPTFRQEAAHYFQVLGACAKLKRAPSPTIFWLGDEEIPLDICDGVNPNNFLPTIVLALRRRLYSRTKCMLEMHDHSKGLHRVDYMHRTAEEWVTRNKDVVYSESAPNFDSNLWVIKGEVLANGLLPLERLIKARMEHPWNLLEAAASVADIPDNMPAVMDVMDKLIAQLNDTWKMLIEGKIQQPPSDIPIERECFLLDWCTKPLPIEHNVAGGLYILPNHGAVNFVGVAAQIPIPIYVKAMVQADPSVLRSEPNVVSVLENAVFGGFEFFWSVRRKATAMSRENGEHRLDLVRFLASQCRDDLELLAATRRKVTLWLSVVNNEYVRSVLAILNGRLGRRLSDATTVNLSTGTEVEYSAGLESRLRKFSKFCCFGL
ncbi:MAG: hypothetical protein M1813_000489 [Trichoglossum hirsutum]|nr:MAG: hypothetical protein M1813_000489 [Trichoglossum hirsutum]